MRQKKKAALFYMSAGSIDSWGPALWRFLHASSFAYPDEPDALRRAQMLEFLKSVGSVLPCKTCRNHYNEYINEHLTEEVVLSKAVLVAWLVDLHNSVNRRTGKKEWTVEDVNRIYQTKTSGGSCPATKKHTITPMAWVLVVVCLAVLGLLVAAQVRRIPN